MANDLERISEAFRILATIAFPDDFLGNIELAAVNAHLDATKAERARKLLATRGPDDAAAAMRCSRSQLYRWARLKVPVRDESGTAPA